jgi:hypothetical protein
MRRLITIILLFLMHGAIAAEPTSGVRLSPPSPISLGTNSAGDTVWSDWPAGVYGTPTQYVYQVAYSNDIQDRIIETAYVSVTNQIVKESYPMMLVGTVEACTDLGDADWSVVHEELIMMIGAREERFFRINLRLEGIPAKTFCVPSVPVERPPLTNYTSATNVGLPTEILAVNSADGDLICIWDYFAQDWLREHENYDHSGSYRFTVPSWNKWYWIGLWDAENGEYVYSKWVGHFVTRTFD